MEINQLVLSLGSNINSRSLYISSACREILSEIGEIINFSRVYSTPPIGFKSKEHFLNCCLIINTKLNKNLILLKIEEIEKKLGRTEKSVKENYISRVIDIDIIFFNKEHFKSQKLIIPHSSFRDRKFVLIPLNEMIPNYIDPISHLTVRQILENCRDNSTITVYKNQFLNTLLQ